MRIGIEQVDRAMVRHLNEGLDAPCERLDYNDVEILTALKGSYGHDGAVLSVAGIAIGIDIGLEVAEQRHKEKLSVSQAHDGHHHDEFLESLPEAYDSYTHAGE